MEEQFLERGVGTYRGDVVLGKEDLSHGDAPLCKDVGPHGYHLTLPNGCEGLQYIMAVSNYHGKYKDKKKTIRGPRGEGNKKMQLV